MKLLSCRDLDYASGGTSILKDVSFEVPDGALMTLTGPSGSGKTTLLRLLADLISPTKGQVLYKNQPVDDIDPIVYRRQVRYVPQTPELFPGTVRDNLKFAFEVHKQDYDEAVAEGILDQFEMKPSYLDKKVVRLSGGEKQRIALMRSLLFEPRVLLLDEPTSALDKTNLLIVEQVLQAFNRRGVTMLWITHNEAQSSRVAKQTIRLKAGRLDEARR